ncbi:MAG TPA: hypothetical protein VKB69_05270 [Micromonosporaceae bacterium]|nr:hypothetical protein [Micromonosporaceae bacterium]
MRRGLFAVPVVACVTLVAAGCGGPVAPRTWVTTVCQSLAPWRSTITQLNGTAQVEMTTATTPRDTQAHMLTLLGGAQRASERARAAVDAAGVPDVEGGAEIERRFVASLAAVRDAYGKAATAVGALPTDDPQSFYKGVASAMNQLATDYQRAGVDTDQLASTELQDDFAQVAACR